MQAGLRKMLRFDATGISMRRERQWEFFVLCCCALRFPFMYFCKAEAIKQMTIPSDYYIDSKEQNMNTIGGHVRVTECPILGGERWLCG